MTPPLIDRHQSDAPQYKRAVTERPLALSRCDLGYSVRQSMTRLLGASNSIDGVFRLTRAVRHQCHRVV